MSWGTKSVEGSGFNSPSTTVETVAKKKFGTHTVGKTASNEPAAKSGLGSAVAAFKEKIGAAFSAAKEAIFSLFARKEDTTLADTVAFLSQPLANSDYPDMFAGALRTEQILTPAAAAARPMHEKINDTVEKHFGNSYDPGLRSIDDGVATRGLERCGDAFRDLFGADEEDAKKKAARVPQSLCDLVGTIVAQIEKSDKSSEFKAQATRDTLMNVTIFSGIGTGIALSEGARNGVPVIRNNVNDFILILQGVARDVGPESLAANRPSPVIDALKDGLYQEMQDNLAHFTSAVLHRANPDVVAAALGQD